MWRYQQIQILLLFITKLILKKYFFFSLTKRKSLTTEDIKI